MACPPLLKVMRKLQRLRGKIKRWNKIVIGDVHVKLAEAEDEFFQAQMDSDRNIDNIEALEKLNAKQIVLNEVVIKKGKIIRHTLHRKWIYKGERNTKMLLGQDKSKVRRDCIVELWNEQGEIVNNQEGIKKPLTATYRSRFEKVTIDRDDNLLEILPIMFSEEDNVMMSATNSN